MQSMTIDQLRAASDAGGVAGVTLKGQGGAFLVQIATRNGAAAVLAKARSSEPRRFGNPIAAFNVLRDVGITIGQFDASDWNPSAKNDVPGNRGRADARILPNKVTNYPVKPGDVLTILVPGSGGYGNPAERDPAAIARDIAEGFVTAIAPSERSRVETALLDIADHG